MVAVFFPEALGTFFVTGFTGVLPFFRVVTGPFPATASLPLVFFIGVFGVFTDRVVLPAPVFFTGAVLFSPGVAVFAITPVTILLLPPEFLREGS